MVSTCTCSLLRSSCTWAENHSRHTPDELWKLQKNLSCKKGSLSPTFKKNTEANAKVYDLNQKTMQDLHTLAVVCPTFEKPVRTWRLRISWWNARSSTAVNSASGWSLAWARACAAGNASLEFSQHVLLLLENVHLGSQVLRTIR